MPRISITDFSGDDRMDIDCKAFTVATTNLGQIIVPDGGPFHPAIRACNLFDELVGACEVALTQLPKEGSAPLKTRVEACDIADKLRAVLAKAKATK